jgi:hypothetical protein
MLCIALAGGWVCAQIKVPPTMGSIRKEMYELSRKLTSYSDEWIFKVTQGNNRTIRFRRFIDGKRHQLAVIMDDRPVLEDGYDGRNAWVIDHLHRTFAAGEAVDKSFDDKTVLTPLDLETGSLRVDMVNAYDIRIEAIPDFRIIAETTDKTDETYARKLVAISEVSPQRKVTVTMWFETTHWQLLKAHVIGRSRDGDPIEAEMVRTRSSNSEAYGSDAFQFAEEKVIGYERRPLSEFGFLAR